MSATTTSDCNPDAAALMAVRFSALLGRIVCGDNTEVLSGFPDACIDLVVTSPPYDNLRRYGGHSWNFETLAAQLTRVLKPGGVIVWVVADATVNGSETLTSMRQAIHFKDVCGLNVHDTMIWNKYLPGLYGKRYTFAWEYMLILSKGEPNAWNPIKRKNLYMGKRGASRRNLNGSSHDGITEVTAEESIEENVWRIPVGGGITSKDGSRHSAAFPDDLAAKHIISWSNYGDVILDPFAGSGTTCKAAKELNRQWCGIEINPEYCAIAEARLSQGVLQLEACAMRPNNTNEGRP